MNAQKDNDCEMNSQRDNDCDCTAIILVSSRKRYCFIEPWTIVAFLLGSMWSMWHSGGQ